MDKEAISEVILGSTGESVTPEQYARLRFRKSQEQTPSFIAGPIPVSWLRKALKLSKAAIKTSFAVWYLHGLTKGGSFKLSAARIGELELDRDTKKRGLADLEKAGLVRVRSRGPSKSKEVTVVVTGGAADGPF